MSEQSAAMVVHRRDYQPPLFQVPDVSLSFSLHAQATVVKAVLHLKRRPGGDATAPCILDGDGLRLESVILDGRTLGRDEYHYDGSRLVLNAVPDDFKLETQVVINPAENTSLEGLYLSNGMFCTQCEAEGFRKITFFPDRPDVLSRFRVTIEADTKACPLLLSNGNPVAHGEAEQGRHWVSWEDPFPKPCYLFALVAGDLACLEDHYETASGRVVQLRIYAEARDLEKLNHAMASLKKAMRWDEQVYGCEYDLDIYMIVAVSHFNMGAMENKGLNVFNTSCVLAHPTTTTDAGFQRVESVVAHEYFHNWSGNRVTCRDWFQLSLKEGFTVFRDQSFSADMHSPAVQRVRDVDMLRVHQFAEDQGPLAHPVRPDSYEKIDNFYTLTVYEKGAEVVRMLHCLLGSQRFRQATDLYFKRFDGQAVTCDDFVDCMQEVSGRDLGIFRRWYSQAGTPVLCVTDDFADGVYRLHLSQHTPDSPGQSGKLPVTIPVDMALLGDDGQPMALDGQGNTRQLLVLEEAQSTYCFTLKARPVPVLLRGFSAPVKLEYAYTAEQLALIVAKESDGFCRWDAAQRLYMTALQHLLEGAISMTEARESLVPLFRSILAGAGDDPAFAALLMTLPGESAIADRQQCIDFQAIHQSRSGLLQALGETLRDELRSFLDHACMSPHSAKVDAEAIGWRALRVTVLEYLAAGGCPAVAGELHERLRHADNMTDQSGALALLVNYQLADHMQALERYRKQWCDEPLVMDMWFRIQAGASDVDGVARVAQLLDDDAFDWLVPNRVRAVLGAFSTQNLVGFHREDGAGYQLFSTALARVDSLNPQMAARLAGAFSRLALLPSKQQDLVRLVLSSLLDQGVSKNLAEVLCRLLGQSVEK